MAGTEDRAAAKANPMRDGETRMLSPPYTFLFALKCNRLHTTCIISVIDYKFRLFRRNKEESMASRRTSEPSNDRAVRISDVAEAAGVSTATVSRALAFPDRLRPETRERVLAAVRRLGYTPNEAARALRAGASRMVLVVVPYL